MFPPHTQKKKTTTKQLLCKVAIAPKFSLQPLWRFMKAWSACFMAYEIILYVCKLKSRIKLGDYELQHVQMTTIFPKCSMIIYVTWKVKNGHINFRRNGNSKYSHLEHLRFILEFANESWEASEILEANHRKRCFSNPSEIMGFQLPATTQTWNLNSFRSFWCWVFLGYPDWRHTIGAWWFFTNPSGKICAVVKLEIHLSPSFGVKIKNVWVATTYIGIIFFHIYHKVRELPESPLRTPPAWHECQNHTKWR